MTAAAEPPEKRSRAIDWPAEWWGDEKFWREVATRTVAGVLTLVILGVPSLVYLMGAGQLTLSIGMPILYGILMVAAAIAIWFIARAIVRAVEKKKARKILREDQVSTAQVQALSDKQFDALVNEVISRSYRDVYGEQLEADMRRDGATLSFRVSPTTRDRLMKIEMLSRIFLTGLGIALALLAGALPFWFQ